MALDSQSVIHIHFKHTLGTYSVHTLAEWGPSYEQNQQKISALLELTSHLRSQGS